MARSWEYASWKRTALAVIMVLVLGVSLGLAELVVRHERVIHPPAAPRQIGSITFHMPSTLWVNKGPIPTAANPNPTEAIAQEPDGERRGRRLILEQVTVSPDVTPEAFVETIRRKYPLFTDWEPGDNISGSDQISVHGVHGVLVAMQDTQPLDDKTDRDTIWVAAAMLAPGRMLAIQLICHDDDHAEEDKETIEGVISGLTLNP